MSAAAEPALSHFAVEDTRPATFLERGVSVPFTTPMLLGARARPAERHGLELSIPNPAGVRGLYVVPLGSLLDICTPTLHDRQICETIIVTPAITPEGMLRIARDVARTGHAGRGAAKAASKAVSDEVGQRLVTNFQLLLHLIQQTERENERFTPAAQDTPANVELRARRAIARTAPRLSLPSETILSGLEALADAYVPVGFRGDPTGARYQRQVSELERLAALMKAWAEDAVDHQEARSASLIARSAELTLACAGPLMKELIDGLDDISQLIQRWAQNGDQLLELIARPAWLLDGWGVLIGIWRNMGEAGPTAAIREMSILVPAMPIEADSWVGANRERFEMVHRARTRFVFRLQEWRSGNMMNLIARNEKLVRDAV